MPRWLSPRLVQKEHFGIVHEGARDGQPLEHPAGEGEDEAIGPVGELEALEQLPRTSLALRRGDAEIGAVEGQDLARGQREIEVLPLGHDAD